MKQKVTFRDLGKISYADAWDFQKERLKEVVDHKLSIRDLPEAERPPRKHYLLLCEHHPVFTLGKSGDHQHLLLNQKGLEEKGIEFFKINRGGDITYHGPGQVVGYPIFDLDGFFTDVHKYVRYLEEAAIKVLADYDIHGERLDGSTGVWLDVGTVRARKICAIGVHLSRWVTMHGFAFNVNTNLEHFNYIVPCGISDKGVTSMEKELGRTIQIEDIKAAFKKYYAELFGFDYVI